MGRDDPIEQLIRWGEARQEVRALILTSTRAIPGARLDDYSDYDVIAVVGDVRSWVEDKAWREDFGAVLVDYWDPVPTSPDARLDAVSGVVYYASGLKIDFTLWSLDRVASVAAAPMPHPELDAGHRVLLDKDRLTAALPAPTYRAYVPLPPDGPTYRRLISDFLVGVPYVAKCLLRDELLPAKWVLDFDMRFNYLLPMLEWWVQCEHGWSIKTGHLGRGLKRWLPAPTWRELESTFAGADAEANWGALFAMVALFDRTAADVANGLGHPYPASLVEDVVGHALRMRQGVYDR